MCALLARRLTPFLYTQRWFLGKHRRIRWTEVRDIVRFPASNSCLLLLRVDYTEGDPEVYVISLSLAREDAAEQMTRENPQLVLGRVETRNGGKGVLYSALRNPAFTEELLGAVARRRRVPTEHGELAATHTRQFRRIWGADRPALEPVLARGEQNNSSVVFGDRFVLKLLRRLEPGVHPEREVGQFLTDRARTTDVPPLAGSIEYRDGEEPMTLAVLHGYVHSEAEAWNHAIDNLGIFFDQALASGRPQPPPLRRHPIDLAAETPPEDAQQFIGTYLEMARLLGRRTGEVHVTLASRTDDPAFAPEPFTDFYRHGLYHGLLSQASRGFEALRACTSSLEDDTRAECEMLLEREQQVRRLFQQVRDQRFEALRIRVHGDLNLRQALFTGKDFVLIDFEGDPDRPLSERRIKRSPLRDVASMLRSFHYASHAVLFGKVSGVISPGRDSATLENWGDFWYAWVSAAYLAGYLSVPGINALLPSSRPQLGLLLDLFLIDKGMRELRYEMNQRPDWLRIPVHGILHTLYTE